MSGNAAVTHKVKDAEECWKVDELPRCVVLSFLFLNWRMGTDAGLYSVSSKYVTRRSRTVVVKCDHFSVFVIVSLKRFSIFKRPV